MIRTDNFTRRSIGATLALLTLGVISGCKNTGEGISKDTELAKQSASAETEKAGENAAKMADHDGIVHIKGHVTSNALKAKATTIATDKIKENQGTDKVMNHLLIQP